MTSSTRTAAKLRCQVPRRADLGKQPFSSQKCPFLRLKGGPGHLNVPEKEASSVSLRTRQGERAQLARGLPGPDATAPAALPAPQPLAARRRYAAGLRSRLVEGAKISHRNVISPSAAKSGEGKFFAIYARREKERWASPRGVGRAQAGPAAPSGAAVAAAERRWRPPRPRSSDPAAG